MDVAEYTPSDGRGSLNKLPLELRDMIYCYVFGAEIRVDAEPVKGKPLTEQLSLLAVSKQIGDEASACLNRSVVFTYPCNYNIFDLINTPPFSPRRVTPPCNICIEYDIRNWCTYSELPLTNEIDWQRRIGFSQGSYRSDIIVHRQQWYRDSQVRRVTHRVVANTGVADMPDVCHAILQSINDENRNLRPFLGGNSFIELCQIGYHESESSKFGSDLLHRRFKSSIKEIATNPPIWEAEPVPYDDDESYWDGEIRFARFLKTKCIHMPSDSNYLLSRKARLVPSHVCDDQCDSGDDDLCEDILGEYPGWENDREDDDDWEAYDDDSFEE